MRLPAQAVGADEAHDKAADDVDVQLPQDGLQLPLHPVRQAGLPAGVGCSARQPPVGHSCSQRGDSRQLTLRGN